VKPRLSYILTGGEAPVPEENELALHPEQAAHPDQNHSDHPSPDSKSLSE
jgi:hypothetical protein